jgi:ribosomal protein S18 acetylase RimI-like enzyme
MFAGFDDLRIRRPTEADHSRVLAMLDDWWAHRGGDAGSRQRASLLPRLFFQHFTSTSHVVERSDGRLVAFLVGFLSPSEPETAYVHFVGVDPALRRAGLGRTLYRRFFRDAERHGARTVRSITSPGNSTSVAFHVGLGFTVIPGDTEGVPVWRDYDGPGRDRVCFTRALDPTPRPAGERDLAALLAGLSPRLHDGAYVFTTVAGAVPEGATPVVVVDEDEGRTLVLRRTQADERGLPYAFVAAWITLQVHSALDAVGLTAAVSRALTEAGISANVVAGFHHDHLFVPYDRADKAVEVLRALARG